MKRKPSSKSKVSAWDAADYLDTEEKRAAFLQAAIDESGDDAAYITAALGVVAKAKGMAETAKKAGKTRASFYKSFDGSTVPGFDTVLKTLHALGLQMNIVPMHGHG